MTVYCYSNSEELFHYSVETESRLEAIEKAKETYPGERVYVGVAVELDPATWFDGDDVENRLAERAYEEVGEAAEGWPDFSKDELQMLTARLQDLVAEFLRETGNEPTFHAVHAVHAY